MGLENTKTLLDEIEGGLVNFDNTTHTINVTYTSASEAAGVATNLKNTLAEINTTSYTANVDVKAKKSELKITGKNGQVITFTISTAARGGIVGSFANGNNSI